MCKYNDKTRESIVWIFDFILETFNYIQLSIGIKQYKTATPFESSCFVLYFSQKIIFNKIISSNTV